MKTFILKAALTLAMIISFLGCSSDDSSCPELTCQNGGVFKDCGCNCTQGYAGANCETQITPSKIKVTNIRVKLFPNYNGANDWDFGSGPDIFVRLGAGNGDENTVVLYSSGYAQDAISNGFNYYDFTPSSPIEINSPLSKHVIALFDYDSTSLNEVMAAFTFNIYEPTNHFSDKLILRDASVPIEFELSLQYQW